MEITKREKAVMAEFLRGVAEQLSNNTCSDLEPDIEGMLSRDEWDTFLDACSYDHEPGDPPMDWQLVEVAALLIENG